MSVAVTLRFDEETKEQLDELIEELGMSFSSFFGVYAKQAIRERGIPFRVTTARSPAPPSHLIVDVNNAQSLSRALAPAFEDIETGRTFTPTQAQAFLREHNIHLSHAETSAEIA